MSMLLTSSALQLVADAGERREPAQLAERFLGEVDVVLAEGFSQAAGAKIEVLRRASGKGPRCAIGDGLVAMVGDCPEIHPELPRFGLEDAAGMAEFLLRRMP
jgi:molybdopterin-guanine dinucleotide biosynthesis protein B